MEALFEFRAVELKKNIEDVLRGVRLAERKVGLKQIKARRGPMFIGVIARSDKFDDTSDVACGPQLTRNGEKNISPITRRSEDFFVVR